MSIAILEKLNVTQRKAAETTHGPNLVIAGPGTGKTQTTGARVAHMLVSDEGIEPSMLLCLTYTEAGVIALRRRLISMIGVTSYKIAIYTFHGLCNEIIQAYPDYFGIRDFEPASELERREIARQIIDELPDDNILQRLRGDIYYDSQRILNLFQTMKDEDWTAEYVEQKCKEFLDDLPFQEEYIYKRANKKTGVKVGDIKVNAIKKEADKIEKLVAASKLLVRYDELLKEKERYDFSDMLGWVLKAWKEDDFFLLTFQERYQFILVDEFQDTNKTQMNLLEKLIDYWGNPNVFCVGDDDQCLYEFNGARIANITAFTEKYNPNIYVLQQNYRSNQFILDAASNIITNNVDRLPYDKNLHAEIERPGGGISVLEFENTTAETASIADAIHDMYMRESDLTNYAVIYRKHSQADDLIRQFEARGVPYQVKRSVNVLDTIIVQQIVSILELLAAWANVNEIQYDAFLFRIMHFTFWGNDIQKIHKYYLNLQDPETRNRKPTPVIETEKVLDSLSELYVNVPLVSLIERIMNDTGLIGWVLKQDNRIQLLQYINTFFGWVKTEGFKNPRITGFDLIRKIDQMSYSGLWLPVIDVQGNANGVTLTTAHGAKGLEYNFVYMLGCTRNVWESSRAGATSFSLPDTLTLSVGENKLESERRAFYVGLTRAERSACLSYAKKNEDGKDLVPSQFIIESGIEINPIPHIDLEKYFSYKFVTNKIKFDLEIEMVKEKLEHFKLSYSAMNKYWKCQVAFYFENILRVPFVATSALIFGNGMHLVMKRLYDAAKEKLNLTYEELFTIFAEYLYKNRAQLTTKQVSLLELRASKIINHILSDYFPQSNKFTLNEFKVRGVLINGVPCKCDIDKMEFEGNDVTEVDYKTGDAKKAKQNFVPRNDKLPMGGDYWQQKDFYALCLRNFPGVAWRVVGARLDILHEDGITMLPAVIDENDLSFMEKLIAETYGSIKAMNFSEGCEDENCQWCNLLKN